MKSVLLICIAACGGSSTTNGEVDAPPVVAKFCDGTPKEIGAGIANAIAVDASGRLLVVGTQVQPVQTLFVRRFLADGSVDASFGTAGVVTVGEVTDGHAVAVRADGSIVVAGGVEEAGDLRPIVLGFTEAGQPSGLRVVDDTSTNTLDRVEVRGDTIIVGSRGIIRQITAGAWDATFGEQVPGKGFAVTATGFAVATRQGSQILTYRMGLDGADLAGTSAMTEANAQDVVAAMSRADRITFVGTAATGTIGDLLVGRSLANLTFDTASYPPNGVAVIAGIHGPRTAVELADDSILVAIDGGMVHVTPNGTLDRMIAITGGTINAVAGWGEHVAGAGTLSGGHAVVVCE